MASFSFWQASADAKPSAIQRYSAMGLQARSEEWRILLTQRTDFYHAREHILDILFNPENENELFFTLSLYERKQKVVFDEEGNLSLRVVRGELIRWLAIPYDREPPEQAGDINFAEFHPLQTLPGAFQPRF